MRKALPGSTASHATFNQIDAWLHQCITEHSGCALKAVKSFLPTRLLDVSQWNNRKALRLVDSRKFGSFIPAYIALSHRWNRQVEASSSTCSNISDRFNKIDADALPKLFLDAVEATARLDTRYLWIDSLCIVQDDALDWAREAALMSGIYQNAYCTFSASLFDTDEKGLFREYDAKHDLVNAVIGSGETSTSVQFCKAMGPWDRDITHGPLQSRGWCYQERELSPRIVYWTAHQVLWECCTWRTCERKPATHNRDLISTPTSRPRTFANIGNASRFEAFVLWRRVVQEYTKRDLSVATDRLPALGGMARIIHMQLGSDYLAGIWAVDLQRSLLWKAAYFQALKRPDVYVAPSWSWAALSGPVSFEFIDDVGYSPYSMLRNGVALVDTCRAEPSTADAYGAVRSGQLTVTAPVLDGDLLPSAHHERHLYDLYTVGVVRFGQMQFDIGADAEHISAVKCIALCAMDHNNIGEGIALVSVEGSATVYKRIGYVWDLDIALFEQADVETISII